MSRKEGAEEVENVIREEFYEKLFPIPSAFEKGSTCDKNYETTTERTERATTTVKTTTTGGLKLLTGDDKIHILFQLTLVKPRKIIPEPPSEMVQTVPEYNLLKDDICPLKIYIWTLLSSVIFNCIFILHNKHFFSFNLYRHSSD